MDDPVLRRLLDDVATGVCPPDEAMSRLRRYPFADLGFARVDHHRVVRQGIPEAVYAPGKSPEQVARIVGELLEFSETPVVLTRAAPDQVAAALDAAAAAGHDAGTVVDTSGGPSDEQARALVVWRPAPARPSSVLVVTAGTADLPVATECATVLEAYGIVADLLCDCGVAGLHRLLASLDQITGADVIVVVAGMEGALASVVGGLTPAPVVAVPTSVGYGSGLAGVTALLSMLSSCAAGITVVGIDNGFGAACAVARLLR